MTINNNTQELCTSFDSEAGYEGLDASHSNLVDSIQNLSIFTFLAENQLHCSLIPNPILLL